MQSRRGFLKVAAAVGAGAYLTSKAGRWPVVFAEIPGGTLSPDLVPKFVAPLIIPPAMPLSDRDATTDYYTIGVRQFTQQILPPRWPRTPVWGYGALADASTFHYPAFTIEAEVERTVRVQWVNQLIDRRGNYLSHLLPVDQTLHWANPPGGIAERDSPGTDPTPYRGPVPIVPHLHGGHSPDYSDGYPEAWFLPAANNVPPDFARVGSWYDYFKAKFIAMEGGAWHPGTATFTYPNDQAPTTLWYHDHTLGLTRVNVYAGPAGFYLIRGGPTNDLLSGELPGPAPAVGDEPGIDYYEIPIVIQDRSFNANGSLFYPDNRAFFEGLHKGQLQIPFIPQDGCTGPSDVAPIWNPEFFGNMIVVNGRTWPYLEVEQRRYRFRFLNGCNSRFLILKFSSPSLSFWQIGADGGFLPAAVNLQQLLLAPAERADVIVDFTNVPVGTEIVLLNLGPDEPFGGGIPDEDFDVADPESTGLVMQYRVIAATSDDISCPPADLTDLPAQPPLAAAATTRTLSLNEAESATVLVVGHPGHGDSNQPPMLVKLACGDDEGVPFGPTHALLGTVTAGGEPNPLLFMDSITENPQFEAVEMWEIHNFTEDAHPIHIHLVQFEVVEREDADGITRAAEPWETGLKDTVISYPGEITRVKAKFDRQGQYVWHCHIVEHEDNEMMRPYSVGPIQNPMT